MIRIVFLFLSLLVASCADTRVGASGGSSGGNVGINSGIGF